MTCNCRDAQQNPQRVEHATVGADNRMTSQSIPCQHAGYTSASATTLRNYRQQNPNNVVWSANRGWHNPTKGEPMSLSVCMTIALEVNPELFDTTTDAMTAVESSVVELLTQFGEPRLVAALGSTGGSWATTDYVCACGKDHPPGNAH